MSECCPVELHQGRVLGGELRNPEGPTLLERFSLGTEGWVGGEGPLVGGEGEGAAEAFDVADGEEADAEEVEVREGEHEAAGGELVEVA